MERRPPDETNVEVQPDTCEVMDGHQHAVSNVEDLADSIATLGQINPVQIIEYPGGRRLIASGRRRWLACKSRALPLRADIWHSEDDDINVEQFARAMRIAENSERTDPSAMDVAIQMRSIRAANGFRNAAELGEHLGMSESRVKRYLSVFQGSDYLLEQAAHHAMPLKTVLELVKLEKKIGPTARKVVAKVAKGELTCADVRRIRDRKPTQKRKPQPRGALFQKRADAVLRSIQDDPAAMLSDIEQLIAALRAYLPETADAA